MYEIVRFDSFETWKKDTNVDGTEVNFNDDTIVYIDSDGLSDASVWTLENMDSGYTLDTPRDNTRANYCISQKIDGEDYYLRENGGTPIPVTNFRHYSSPASISTRYLWTYTTTYELESQKSLMTPSMNQKLGYDGTKWAYPSNATCYFFKQVTLINDDPLEF